MKNLWNSLFALALLELCWIGAKVVINEESTCEDVIKSGECNCTKGLLSLFLKCNFSNAIIEGRFKGKDSATIECSGEPFVNRSFIIGKRNAVYLRNCIYQSPWTLWQMLDELGSSDEKEIEIKYDNFTEINLAANFFQGFQELRSLRLNFRIIHMTSETFNDLKKLEMLSLRGRYGHLPNDLLKNLDNLVELTLKDNQLEEIPSTFFIAQSKLTHLDVSMNLLRRITEDTFQKLTSLAHLDLSDNRIESLHERSFQGMMELKFLSLKSNKLETLPDSLLRGLILLANLDLSGNQLRVLPPDLLRNHTQLFRSDLSKNGIETLPGMLFETNAALQYINISYNSLITLPSKIFHSLQKLISLDVSNNQLGSLDPDVFEHSPYVIFLYLQNNRLWFAGSLYRSVYDFQEGSRSPFWPVRAQLRELNLRNNSIDRMNIAWIESPELRELDLSHNRLSKFDNEDFKLTSNQMVVNLEHNQITMLSLLASDATKGSGGFVLFKLNHNPVNCDCRIASFVRFLQMTGHVYRRWRFTVDHLRCREPEVNRDINVVKVNVVNLICQREEHCPEGCRCFVRWNNESVLVNCDERNLTELPILHNVSRSFKYVELSVRNNSIRTMSLQNRLGYEKVIQFYASHNQMQNLTANLFPNVRVLDLSNNNLSCLLQLTHLLNSSDNLQSVNLSFNHWQCDCKSIDQLKFIQNSTDRIVDSKYMRCSDDRDFNLLTVSDVCAASTVATAIVIACLFIIFTLAASFACYVYQIEIKIWLFTNNFCLSLVTEEEIDKDKLYDAFVSYCHQDEEFVSTTLVPRLENAPMNLKVCWHMRDWSPGEVITTQIVQSIENSRRTIVVLSKDFLESSWGQLEFRTAHVNSMAEKRIRVIIVIYGDLGDEDRIDSEMKAYLKTNTYIRWGDPWFWPKLRYSMPHPARVKGIRWKRDGDEVEIEGPSGGGS
ncbi:protein toll-like [Ochlerotatus camptorhynchus]|uniref:protein toll-like n=1 Tax=Ochlerotatus camptorhynchus TaxID=644619 RepID=UPI0031DA38CA